MTTERFDKAAATWDENPLRQQLATAISSAMKKALPLNREMQALEIGCWHRADHHRTGAFTERGAGHRHLGRYAVRHQGEDHRPAPGQRHRPIPRLDRRSLPLPAHSFDLVYSSMVFHHIKETGKILRRCRELLRPGGILGVADLDEEDGSFHEEMPDVAHFGFNQEKLSQLAQQAGFSKIDFSTAHVVSKTAKGESREYPIFLMVAR